MLSPQNSIFKVLSLFNTARNRKWVKPPSAKYLFGSCPHEWSLSSQWEARVSSSHRFYFSDHIGHYVSCEFIFFFKKHFSSKCWRLLHWETQGSLFTFLVAVCASGQKLNSRRSTLSAKDSRVRWPLRNSLFGTIRLPEFLSYLIKSNLHLITGLKIKYEYCTIICKIFLYNFRMCFKIPVWFWIYGPLARWQTTAQCSHHLFSPGLLVKTGFLTFGGKHFFLTIFMTPEHYSTFSVHEWRFTETWPHRFIYELPAATFIL